MLIWWRLVTMAVLTTVVTGLSGCAGSSGSGATATATTPPPAATATVVAFSPARLAPALMSMERVNQLIGTALQTQRDRATDPQLPFSSVPTMGSTLAAQQVSLLYNSFQVTAAPAPGRPYNVQNTTQGYPAAANAMTAFAALRTAWQGNLFQNLQTQENLGADWQESFCQLGNFVNTSGQASQTSQWYVCMARSGPYVVTVSVGALPGMDVQSVSQVVRTYFGEALRAVQ
jgi:hypothetical protein